VVEAAARAVSGPGPAAGVVRPARRPAGWSAPGPVFRGDVTSGRLGPRPREDLCYLAGDWRILQRLDGHRWSLDDLLTAWLAQRHVSSCRRFADMGCGVGSVLLLHAWRYPLATGVGVEAQARSVGLCRRSVELNGVSGRVRVVQGDLREVLVRERIGSFDLVTGTPPYFGARSHTRSDAVQKGPCRFEDRGGVVDYVAAVGRVLAPEGRAAICFAHAQWEAALIACAAAGLRVVDGLAVVPRAGRAPLIGVVALHRGPGDHASPRPLVVRDGEGAFTPEMREIRAAFGIPTR
jgi:tRNA1Val (adenine37-N6)-methyltransferase